ncbi:hypothetical protein [Puniceibacterium sediminis]|uniref:Conserved repeat domain-containing protein n=1 Tax=Puniceibacterium sediminis TaxID=1608407 RepID=A0A238XM83_9RHOB|nr:hypothetical protein [Puniceibacterium sediminis]SNR59573.1 conserved repeat domain-containing protein [Puniceibacterium sediminis]
MFSHIPHISRAALIGMALSMVGVSASADALSSNFSFLIVEKDESGQEKLVERASVRPGEVIHYQLSHENMTDDAMAGIVIAAPVPEGVSLTLGGETTSIEAVFEVQAELDPEQEGLEWSTLPAMRMVADADGVLQQEPLPEEEVAAVRWTFSEPLEAGETAFNSYRVRVE